MCYFYILHIRPLPQFEQYSGRHHFQQNRNIAFEQGRVAKVKVSDTILGSPKEQILNISRDEEQKVMFTSWKWRAGQVWSHQAGLYIYKE